MHGLRVGILQEPFGRAKTILSGRWQQMQATYLEQAYPIDVGGLMRQVADDYTERVSESIDLWPRLLVLCAIRACPASLNNSRGSNTCPTRPRTHISCGGRP